MLSSLIHKVLPKPTLVNHLEDLGNSRSLPFYITSGLCDELLRIQCKAKVYRRIQEVMFKGMDYPVHHPKLSAISAFIGLHDLWRTEGRSQDDLAYINNRLNLTKDVAAYVRSNDLDHEITLDTPRLLNYHLNRVIVCLTSLFT